MFVTVLVLYKLYLVDEAPEAREIADKIRSEFVVEVEGKVVLRDASQVNPNIETGKIEVVATDIKIINTSKTPPFAIEDYVDINEDVRLKYRYLDLRRPVMYNTFKLRSM